MEGYLLTLAMLIIGCLVVAYAFAKIDNKELKSIICKHQNIQNETKQSLIRLKLGAKQETYVSMELFQQLEDKGFPIMKIPYRYNTKNYNEKYSDLLYKDGYCYKKPTLTTVVSWLRNVKKVDILPYRECRTSNEYLTVYNLEIINKNTDPFFDRSGYPTYDKALEAGIKRAINLI